MYSMAQVGVGVGWVDAHSVPYQCSRNITCRGKKKNSLDIRFRVCRAVWSNHLQEEGATSLQETRVLWGAQERVS
jgi:hypothetical protein